MPTLMNLKKCQVSVLLMTSEIYHQPRSMEKTEEKRRENHKNSQHSFYARNVSGPYRKKSDLAVVSFIAIPIILSPTIFNLFQL